MSQVVTIQISAPLVSQEQISPQTQESSSSYFVTLHSLILWCGRKICVMKEAVTKRISSLFTRKYPTPETQFLDLNNGICIEHVVSYLSCKERSRLGFACKVLNGIRKSSYKDWAQVMYEANRETALLSRIGIQVPSSPADAIEQSETFFKSVKVRLEEINKTLPPDIKHEGSILNLLLNQTKTVDFLETLYQYSLVQVFRKNVGVADTMPLKQQAEHVLAWLNTPEQVESVTSLHLDGKKLFCIPREIGKLMNLTWLDVSENRLTSLPPEIGKLTNLTSLDVSENRLTSLPPEIGKLTNLTSLDVSRNKLTSLPPEIGALTELTFLYVWVNQLTSLPLEIGKLTNLTSLNVWGNLLTSLPPEIGNLPNLTDLWLDQTTADKSLSEIETMKRRGVRVILD